MRGVLMCNRLDAPYREKEKDPKLADTFSSVRLSAPSPPRVFSVSGGDDDDDDDDDDDRSA